jgi:bifunctional DNA-binding transcriptional regulator/antitoxin component of YhaV-PrlF toxin-antitoxin module
MSYIAKVTSKGQLTLPNALCKSLGLSKDAYVVIDAVGEYMLMKKIKTRMEEITGIFEGQAKKQKVTREDLLSTLERVQKEKWRNAES